MLKYLNTTTILNDGYNVEVFEKALKNAIKSPKDKKTKQYNLNDAYRDLLLTKQCIPILKNILVKNNQAILTNLDMFVCFKNVTNNGMFDNVKDGLYNPELAIKNKKPIVINDNLCKISDLSIDDFPVIPEFKQDKVAVFNTKDIDFVSRAMSTEETRYYLNGIYFGNDEIAATDGHRLHYKKVACQNINKIVPKEAIKLLLKLGIENIYFDDKNLFMFENESVRVVGKIIDGSFPEYKRVIPTGNYDEKQFNFDTSLFKNNNVIVDFETKQYVVIDNDRNKIQGSQDVLDKHLKQLKENTTNKTSNTLIAFKGDYLKDALRLDGYGVIKNFGSIEPAIINDTCVLMPINQNKL